jgi:undecaprenyl pyrophosphate phosphatase UppP
MKLGRLFIIGIATIIAVAAAIATIVYFKDEILEILSDVRKKFDQKTTRIFHNSEYTDYADI